MSLDATTWAWRQNVRPTLKLILLSLADRANEEHQCFPSIERLVHDTGLNRKTVLANLRELASEQCGLVEITKRKNAKGQHMRNIYTLIGVPDRHKREMNPEQKEQHETPVNTIGHSPGTKNGTRPENQDDETGTKIAEIDENHVPLSAKTMSQKWDTNLSVNLLLSIGGDETLLDLEAWDDFVRHRVEVKEPLNETAAQRAYKLLAKLPKEEQSECVDRSILSGWRGLFPEKLRGSNGKYINDSKKSDFLDEKWI